jgi:hypothetical protein
MSTPLALVATGSFTSDGTATTLQFSQPIDKFVVRNTSIWGSNPADLVVESTWYSSYAQGQATTISEAATGVMSATLVAAGGAGFRAVDQSTLADGALVAVGTAITAATPAVVSDASAVGTAPVVGDIVRMINTTGMLQIAGLEFEVTAATAGVSYTLGYLPAAGFAAAATNADFRIVNQSRFTERRRWITAITAANPAVVTTSIAHGYSVGDRVTINVPDALFGMTEINGLNATITAVTASTFTTDIDSSAFTAFAFPTSAQAAAGITHASVVPFGEVATSLASPTDNVSLFGLELGTAVVGSNTDVMAWEAYASQPAN